MAITNYLVHFKTETTFNANKNQLRNDAVAFVGDATIIHTHGTDYYCGSGPVALESDLANYATTSALTSGLAGKANTSHTHIASQVSGLATVATSGSYNDLNDKPNIPSMDDIATQSWVQSQGYLTSVSWSDVGGKPSTFTPSAHTHEFEDINFDNAGDYNQYLAGDGRFYTIRYDEISDTPNLDNYLTSADLDNYATDSELSSAIHNHNHTAGDIISGTINIDRIPTGTTADTVALGNHTHNYATKSHTHTANDITSGTFTEEYYFDKAPIFEQGIVLWDPETSDYILSVNADYQLTLNGFPVLTSDNYSDYISSTDTKNTTGTSDSSSKLYLAGGTTQNSIGVVTYSNSNVYTQSGQLYATQMNATNGFYETSDARLKNFKDDIKALDVVSEIPTKYFTWKKDETNENSDPKLHIGTSAQEIQKLYPDLVTKNEEGELSVDYARLSVIALAAIKELKKEIDMLKSDSVKYKF